MRIRDMIKRLAANRNESIADDVEAHGFTSNTNESIADDVEAHGFVANTNEDAAGDGEPSR